MRPGTSTQASRADGQGWPRYQQAACQGAARSVGRSGRAALEKGGPWRSLPGREQEPARSLTRAERRCKSPLGTLTLARSAARHRVSRDEAWSRIGGREQTIVHFPTAGADGGSLTVTTD